MTDPTRTLADLARQLRDRADKCDGYAEHEANHKAQAFYGKATGLREAAAELEAFAARVPPLQTEKRIREYLWLSHGHSHQYGDDGEMQCSQCAPFGAYDYKREPLDKLLDLVAVVGLHRARDAMQERLAARVPPQEQERWFPITPPMTSKQAAKSGPSPARIPWSTAEKAYAVYAGQYGRSQTLERIAERGGFYAEEMDDLFPGWRDEAAEITALQAHLAALRAQIDPLVQEMKAKVRVDDVLLVDWRGAVVKWVDTLAALGIDPDAERTK